MTDTPEARQARQDELNVLNRRALDTGLLQREVARKIGRTVLTYRNNLHLSDQPPTPETLDRLKRLVAEREAALAAVPPPPTPEEIAAREAAKEEADRLLKAEFRAVMDEKGITAGEAADFLDRDVGMVYRWRGKGPAPTPDKIEALRKLAADRKGTVYVSPKKGKQEDSRVVAARRREQAKRKATFKKLFDGCPGVTYKQVADALGYTHGHMDRLLWHGRSFPEPIDVEKMRVYVEVVGPELVAFERDTLAEVRRQAKADAKRMIAARIEAEREKAIRKAEKEADDEWVAEVMEAAKDRRKSEIVAVRKAAEAIVAVIDRAKEDPEAKGAILHALRRLDELLGTAA